MDFKKPRKQMRVPDADDTTAKQGGAFVPQIKAEMMRRVKLPDMPSPMRRVKKRYWDDPAGE